MPMDITTSGTWLVCSHLSHPSFFSTPCLSSTPSDLTSPRIRQPDLVSPVRSSVIHALLVDFGPPGHHASHPTSPWICRPPSCSCRSSPAPRTSRPPPSSRNRAPPPPTCHRHTVPPYPAYISNVEPLYPLILKVALNLFVTIIHVS